MTSIETAREKLPVLLSIRGEQYFDDVDPDATELMTEGTLELTEDGLRARLRGNRPHRDGGYHHRVWRSAAPG